uniref:Uncharacterized protein n=1 Tax=Ascaris lumbricoides TaxID=6252 RepID=A0A0M3I2B4_ASCLU
MFIRSPKWARLAPSGGSLVSGRGNFRPGFVSSAADTRMLLSEPLLIFKVQITLRKNKVEAVFLLLLC